jgi:Phage terminase large subunit (GpA)
MREKSNSSSLLSDSDLLEMSVEELELLLASHPKSIEPEVQRVLKPAAFDEKTYDRERKAKQRAAGREIYIPPPKNIELRLQCLADPELLLTTYFPATYCEPFTEDRRDMLTSICRAAKYSGDQAIAGSRGEGKTTIAMDGAFSLMLMQLTFFPVVISKNQDSASDELKALRERIMGSERFIEDFPELGIPLQVVGPSTANARLQTVGGKFTGMYLGLRHFAFPKITNEQLPHWPHGVESMARGQVIGAVGIGGKIRGFKFRSHRPTLAIIDDIEDKDSVRSDDQIAKIESIIEEDIGGMGASAERIARVYLCTTLNRKCNAYKYTDRKQKPSWNGRRYRKMVKPPDRIDLVQEYIQLRKGKTADDPDARVAFRYWRDNQKEIESGCIVSNPYSYSKKIHSDGEPLELSAIQSYYNRVADTSEVAVATEIDNDPPDEVGPQTSGLTSTVVQSRLSGFDRGQLPANTVCLTAGIDLGKYRCYWTVTAWWKGAGGVVVDYGVAEVIGTETEMTKEASEPAIYNTLLDWRSQLLTKNYVDATGERRKVDAVFVDSGDFTDAAYKFIRDVGGSPFYAVKGFSPYRAPKQSNDQTKLSDHLHASRQENGIWLYVLDVDYWKQFIHERFLTPPFDDQNMLRAGSLSLFRDDTKRHLSYSQHIVSEELVSEFIEGKGTKVYWRKNNANNHWLDSTSYSAAAAGALGVNLLELSSVPLKPKEHDKNKPKPQPQTRQHGFRQRPGGWVNGARRR